MSGIPTNRSNISLPTDISTEIIAKTQEASAVMRLARHIPLPGRGLTIPVIAADAEADWVAETGRKPVSNPSLSTKLVTPYKLATILPFSKEFMRDNKTLYDELVRRGPNALARKFDQTVLGAVNKPGDNFDNFANATAQSLIATETASLYDGLVAAVTDISVHGGILDGWALSPQAKGLLLGAVDTTKRPLFIDTMASGDVPRLLGAPTYFNKGMYKAGTAGTPGTPAVVGVAGDWSQALYGTVEGVKVSFADQATLTTGSGASEESFNLWQNNMIAVMFEIEVGFRADVSVFNLLTGAVPTA